MFRSFLLTAALLSASNLFAAMIVTSAQRLNGAILAQDDTSLTLKRDDGTTLKIPRDKILQIFDDKGELVWQAILPPEEKRIEMKTGDTQLNFASRSILIDFCIGSAFGGFYAEENRFFADTFKVSLQYSDGSAQTTKASMRTLGVGISYQSYGSIRWSDLWSYTYRSTAQTLSTDSNPKQTLSDQTTTTLHALLYGKELHFYPLIDSNSIDIIGQAGYEFGNYKPLAIYNDIRTSVTPIPASLNTPSNVFIHGPTIRIGTGVTFRGTNWLFRILGFYQIAYTFASDQIWTAVPKNTPVHDLYAGISFGYGW